MILDFPNHHPLNLLPHLNHLKLQLKLHLKLHKEINSAPLLHNPHLLNHQVEILLHLLILNKLQLDKVVKLNLNLLNNHQVNLDHLNLVKEAINSPSLVNLLQVKINSVHKEVNLDHLLNNHLLVKINSDKHLHRVVKISL